MGTLRHVSAMDNTGGDIKKEDIIEDMVFSIDQINRKISSLKRLESGKTALTQGSQTCQSRTYFKFLTNTQMSPLNIYVNVGE